jgi:hypothetical protein
VPFCIKCDTPYIQLKAVLKKIAPSVFNHSVPSVTLGIYIYCTILYIYTECFCSPEC